MSMNDPNRYPDGDPRITPQGIERPRAASPWVMIIGGLVALFFVIGLYSLATRSNDTTANRTTTSPMTTGTEPRAPTVAPVEPNANSNQPALPTPQNTRP